MGRSGILLSLHLRRTKLIWWLVERWISLQLQDTEARWTGSSTAHGIGWLVSTTREHFYESAMRQIDTQDCWQACAYCEQKPQKASLILQRKGVIIIFSESISFNKCSSIDARPFRSISFNELGLLQSMLC